MIKPILISLIVLLSVMSYAQETPPASNLQDSAKVIQPQAIPLVEINFRMEETRQFIANIADELEFSAALAKIDSMIVVRDMGESSEK